MDRTPKWKCAEVRLGDYVDKHRAKLAHNIFLLERAIQNADSLIGIETWSFSTLPSDTDRDACHEVCGTRSYLGVADDKPLKVVTRGDSEFAVAVDFNCLAVGESSGGGGIMSDRRADFYLPSSMERFPDDLRGYRINCNTSRPAPKLLFTLPTDMIIGIVEGEKELTIPTVLQVDGFYRRLFLGERAEEAFSDIYDIREAVGKLLTAYKDSVGLHSK